MYIAIGSHPLLYLTDIFIVEEKQQIPGPMITLE